MADKHDSGFKFNIGEASAYFYSARLASYNEAISDCLYVLAKQGASKAVLDEIEAMRKSDPDGKVW